jgi:tetratricopeptide (TPR) repeat protein
LVAVLAVAALLRLAHLWTLADAPFVGEPVLDSAEYHRWGRELAAGGWRGEGAFFQAPLYPYLLGALYSLAGPRPAAAYLLQIAVAVAAVWALWRCGSLLGGWRVGLVAAALAAACGVLVFHDALLLKESLATSLVAFLLWALVAAREEGARAGRWLAAGVLLGTLAGLRENALLLVPLLLGLPWLRPPTPNGVRERAGPGAVAPWTRRSALAASAALVAGVALAMAPIAARNWVVTGQPLLTTFQGGVNFWIGNNPQADGTYRPLVPGRQVPVEERRQAVRLAEQALGRTLSPREVSRYWLGRALAWAAAEPRAFAALQVRKLVLFWSPYEWPDAVDYAWVRARSPALRLAWVERASLALLALAGLVLVRTEWRRWAPVLLLIAGWTAITVAFFVFSRYRLPVVPGLALLGAVPLARLPGALRTRRRGARWAAAAASLALLLPSLRQPAPRLDLVHGNLGLLAVEQGRDAQAASQFRSALAAAPESLQALVGLGSVEARRGRVPEARALFARAVAAHPDSPEAVANLGAAELALGELAAAERHLRAALALDPQHLGAAHNLATLLARRGALAEAREWNRRVLAQAPEHPAARRLATRLAGGTDADARR